MKIAGALLLSLFVSLSYSATPAAKWPPAFSSSLDLYRRSQRQFFVSRWFRDDNAKMERFDTSGSGGYDIDIRRYDKGRRYTVYHEMGEVKCVITNLTTTMPQIDFSDYKYNNQAYINSIPCFEFDAPQRNSQFSRYFQNQATSDPVRLETAGPNDEILDFFEFDAGSQEESLFDVTVVAPGITCNYAQNVDLGFVRMAWLDSPDNHLFNYYAPPLLTQNNVTGPMDCESGQASWYACSGNGACAACNPSEYTAAHKTLPCGTATTVTDTANGKSVQVKIEDRGPYVAGRIIDMNQGPAEALGMISAGVVPARVCW
eukprot:Phypoly_transcript_11212.p1 GENE.Phypoly_transcript_11212~~Phypoly_transcript_11212.p1  ORF type:complete len:316 (+),score=51.01 Phypoly_transcript_11212:209-1156(+)